MMSFNVVLSPLYLCILAVRSRGLVRLDLIFCQEHFIDSVAWFHQEALMSDCFSFCNISSHWWSLPSVINYRRLQNDNFIILSCFLHLLAEKLFFVFFFFYKASSSSLDIWTFHTYGPLNRRLSCLKIEGFNKTFISFEKDKIKNIN